MSGQLNPRDYDLGELRDAVRETTQRHRPDGRRGREPSTEEAPSSRENPPRSERSEPREQPSEQRAQRDERQPRQSRQPERSPEAEPRRARNDRARGDRHRSARRTAASQGHENEPFELLSQLSRRGVERPYLTRLPDAYSAQLEVFDWLEALLSKGGLDATLEALEYYESIGWLSESSREHLEEFTGGLAASDPPDPEPLGVDDHRRSLVFIARLSHRLYD